MKKIQVLQNKLLKVLYKLPFRTDTDVLHSSLDILKVKDIYKYQAQKFVYETVNKKIIPQFHDYYVFNHDRNTRQRGTRQDNDLYKDNFNNQYGEFKLKRHGAVMWNALDNSIKSSQSLLIFKRALRKSIIDTYRT